MIVFYFFMQRYQKTQDHLTDPKVNLLTKADNQRPKGKKIFKVSKFIIYLLVVLIVAFLVFSYQVLFTNNSITDVFSGKINIFKQLNSLAGGGNLQGESDDRINFLLLGMGGKKHDGPYLTDTIIFASLKPSTKEAAMISVPRDLLVEIPGYGWWKINNANAFGEQKNFGQGALLTKEVVENLLNQPIHYYVRIDFSGFEKMIDELGGIKVQVDTPFTDFQFPTKDHKYKVVSFEKGWQTMDGETALNFTRSRHGNNGQGSDFARSLRQQKVIQAIKNRVFSYNFFLSPGKISGLLSELSKHLKTDLEPWEILKLAKLVQKTDLSSINTKILDDSPGGYLYASIVNEAYVLKPRGDDLSDIQYLADTLFSEKKITAPKTQPARFEIRNGTTIPGLASRNSQELKQQGYKVIKIGNAPQQNHKKTVIYKLSDRELNKQSNYLKKQYNSTIMGNQIPEWISNSAAPDLDFMIVLGLEANNQTDQ